MTIDLPGQLEHHLRRVAEEQGRAPETTLEEAVRQDLDAAAITDLQTGDVAATQPNAGGSMTHPTS